MTRAPRPWLPRGRRTRVPEGDGPTLAARYDRQGARPPSDRYPVEEVAAVHDRVDAGTRGRVLVTVPQ